MKCAQHGSQCAICQAADTHNVRSSCSTSDAEPGNEVDDMCYASLPRTLCVPCTVRECLERKRVGWVGGWFRELSVSAIGEVTRPSSRGRTSELSTFDEGFEGGYLEKKRK